MHTQKCSDVPCCVHGRKWGRRNVKGEAKGLRQFLPFQPRLQTASAARAREPGSSAALCVVKLPPQGCSPGSHAQWGRQGRWCNRAAPVCLLKLVLLLGLLLGLLAPLLLQGPPLPPPRPAARPGGGC